MIVDGKLIFIRLSLLLGFRLWLEVGVWFEINFESGLVAVDIYVFFEKLGAIEVCLLSFNEKCDCMTDV